jgi:hypothetical protein
MYYHGKGFEVGKRARPSHQQVKLARADDVLLFCNALHYFVRGNISVK